MAHPTFFGWAFYLVSALGTDINMLCVRRWHRQVDRILYPVWRSFLVFFLPSMIVPCRSGAVPYPVVHFFLLAHTLFAIPIVRYHLTTAKTLFYIHFCSAFRTKTWCETMRWNVTRRISTYRAKTQTVSVVAPFSMYNRGNVSGRDSLDVVC